MSTLIYENYEFENSEDTINEIVRSSTVADSVTNVHVSATDFDLCVNLIDESVQRLDYISTRLEMVSPTHAQILLSTVSYYHIEYWDVLGTINIKTNLTECESYEHA